MKSATPYLLACLYDLITLDMFSSQYVHEEEKKGPIIYLSFSFKNPPFPEFRPAFILSRRASAYIPFLPFNYRFFLYMQNQRKVKWWGDIDDQVVVGLAGRIVGFVEQIDDRLCEKVDGAPVLLAVEISWGLPHIVRHGEDGGLSSGSRLDLRYGLGLLAGTGNGKTICGTIGRPSGFQVVACLA